MKVRWKIPIASLAFLLTVLGLWSVYSPLHWMRRINFATVYVDSRRVAADVYIGHPTLREAEAIVLVHVPHFGEYFLDFEEEDYREASKREFVRLMGGIWTLKGMNTGQFRKPLPPGRINQFRLAASSGHIVTVQF